ncbi:hypothetical protein BH09PSE5_BH09PSE5_12860 [soil metagenome]
MSESKLVTALFKDRESAERAYKVVAERGYGHDDVSVAMTHDTREQHFSHPKAADGAVAKTRSDSPLIDDDDEEETELSNMAAEGAGIGAGIGGTIGAIAAALAAVGTALALPGIGLFMAGPIVAALVGAGAGAATGGLVGALVGWGIPEERVKHYEAGLHGGGILMAVKARTHEDAQHFMDLWRHHDGEQVYR